MLILNGGHLVPVQKHMKINMCLALAGLGLVGLCGSAAAAPSERQLAREAKISRGAAEKIALGRVRNGKVSAGELEREHGKLIWSFDIATPGTRDIEEVQVDAKSSEVVSVKTETPKDQAAEVAADKKK